MEIPDHARALAEQAYHRLRADTRAHPVEECIGAALDAAAPAILDTERQRIRALVATRSRDCPADRAEAYEWLHARVFRFLGEAAGVGGAAQNRAFDRLLPELTAWAEAQWTPAEPGPAAAASAQPPAAAARKTPSRRPARAAAARKDRQ